MCQPPPQAPAPMARIVCPLRDSSGSTIESHTSRSSQSQRDLLPKVNEAGETKSVIEEKSSEQPAVQDMAHADGESDNEAGEGSNENPVATTSMGQRSGHVLGSVKHTFCATATFSKLVDNDHERCHAAYGLVQPSQLLPATWYRCFTWPFCFLFPPTTVTLRTCGV
ncbi:hypothetical protein F5Y18DRAFT_173613 [Xylariaceae sp. FL1019]|nr:hypothetical protein F5Y18DRAFT_173613 [Xylariaceae sp. FL1019]